MEIATNPQPRANLTAMALEALGGAVVGAVIAGVYLTSAVEIRWSDVLALIIAMVCIIGAIRLFAESFDPAAVARRLGVEGEGTKQEMNDVRLQAFSGAVFGFAIFWPVLATLKGGPAPAISYVVVAAALGLQIWMNWRAAKKDDEYARQYTRHISWTGVIVGQLGLMAYAAGERLGLLQPLTAWDVFVVFTAITIVAGLFSLRGKVRV